MKETWTDREGMIHWCLSPRNYLNYKTPSAAALRSFVYYRDCFTCQRCGAKPEIDSIPIEYDGKRMISDGKIDLYIDHIKPLAAGGTHHPNNLQTLCRTCNSIKCSEYYNFIVKPKVSKAK